MSSSSTIKVAAVVTPIPGTEVRRRIGFSKGALRDISRMARVSWRSILRKRTNCSRCSSKVFLPYSVESSMEWSQARKRFDQRPIEERVNSSGIYTPWKRSNDLMRFFVRVLSFTIMFLVLIKERISRTSALGTYIPSNEPERNSRASLLQSTASVLRSFSLLMVGTSAGWTTMLVIPKPVSFSCIQKPQNPASYTEK